MKKGFSVNLIIAILMLAASTTLGMALFSYLQENFLQEPEVSIQIKNAVNTQIAEEGIKENTYSIQSLQPAGESTIATGMKNSSFHGTKYFYEQLDTYAKVIYQAFENNVENLKTGTYQIEFNSEFDELLKQENGNEILNDEFQRAWDAFSYDRPDVFYLDPGKFSLTVETTKRAFRTSYKVYINAGSNGNYYDGGFSSKEQINDYISQMESLKQQFVSQMTAMNSDYDRIKSLHDWIVDNIEYDSSMQQVHRYNIYGALIERNVVCEGYAKLFKYILDDMGIESVLVSGTAINTQGENERHMWNYVKIDGTWYAVDCTWDDPIIVGGGKITPEIKKHYFLKGTSFYEDHTEEPITAKSTNLSYPKIAEQDYKK